MPSPASERLTYAPDSEIVRAGAGAGKTYALVAKVAEVARAFREANGRWPRVVATTFTRKATQELRERLMLKALSDAPDLIEFVNSRGNLAVSTIHGVLDMFLKRHGSELGVDPGYKVIGSTEATRLARRVLRDCLFADPAHAEMLERFPFDRLASLARKRDELASREPEARPYAFADFEALAREELGRLADDLEEAGAQALEQSTKADWTAMAEGFLGLAKRLRAREGWAEKRDEAIAFVGTIKKGRWSEKNPPVDELTNELCEIALKRARALDEPLYDPAAWAQFAETFAAFEALALRFAEAFRAEKSARGELEISDLEAMAMESVRRHPEAAAAFAAEWDFWLIDEYQDTSPFQVELLRALTQGKPVYVVGDPQQSIYLFRGARSEVFAAKEAEIAEGGGARGFLRRNYRSRPELLAFFNAFFASFKPPFAAMEPNLVEGDAVDPERVVATFYVAPEGSDEGEQPAQNQNEWQALVRRAQDLLAAGARPDEICVLARTNRDLTDAAIWLNRYGVPTHVHASSGFYDRRETLDTLSFLKFLVNPHDDGNAVELLRSPWFRVPDEDLSRLAAARYRNNSGRDSKAKGQPSYWSVIVRDASAREWEGARILARYLELKRKVGLTEAFRAGLIECGFVDFSHVHDMSGRRESNLWKLVAQLAQEEAMPGFNPLAFVSGRLQDAKRAEGGQEGDAVAALEPDRVNLMTIHASKGLQFKHVLLPRMGQAARLTRSEEFSFDEGRKLWSFRAPMGESLEFEASLAEKAWLEKFREHERLEHDRVLYVALTRAKESVYMSWTAPAKPHSWAADLRWPLVDASGEPIEGVAARDGFRYEVWPPEPPAPLSSASGGYEAKEPRAPFAPVARWTDAWLATDGVAAIGAASDAARGRQSASVTKLLERAARAKPELASSGGLGRRIRVAQEGVAMHRLMELLQNPSREQLAILARKWFPHREDEALQAIERVQAMREPPLLELIRDGHAEWGFAFREGGAIVEGQIDLWGRDPAGQLWIVDYKSGSPERRAQAFAQMSLYALALRKAGIAQPGERARLAAVYPFSGKAFVESEPEASETRAKFGLEGPR